MCVSFTSSLSLLLVSHRFLFFFSFLSLFCACLPSHSCLPIISSSFSSSLSPLLPMNSLLVLLQMFCSLRYCLIHFVPNVTLSIINKSILVRRHHKKTHPRVNDIMKLPSHSHVTSERPPTTCFTCPGGCAGSSTGFEPHTTGRPQWSRRTE